MSTTHGRGSLRIYLGMAPGVGKTYAMLSEGRRGRARGKDVVVGIAETHGREATAELLAGFEIVPRRTVEYRGATFEELDLAAVLARRPQLALIDELAHTNVPNSGHAKRWEDVETLLVAGIDVITSVNIQHLESLNDVIERITGVTQRETIPDGVVRGADQLELVDMSPEALRRRMAHGNVYPPERIDAALANYFRPGNLTALRELALLWVAGRVDEALLRYRHEHQIDTTWETRERVVVALTGGPEGDTLIRRGARIAARSGGGELLAVHIARSDGLYGASPRALARQRELVERLGGAFHQMMGDDPAVAMLEFARAENATQIVLGASRRGRMVTFLTGEGVSARVVRESGPIDVHIVTHEKAGHRRGLALPLLSSGLTGRRQAQGAAVGLVALVALTGVLLPLRGPLTLPSQLLLYLLVVVVIGLLGGIWPALGGAVLATVLVNFFFTPPVHTFNIAERNNIIALVVFVAVAVMVSWVVQRSARQTRRAAHATAEAQTLSTLAGSVLRGQAVLPALLDRVRETFGLSGAALLESTRDGWRTVESTDARVPVVPPAAAGASADTRGAGTQPAGTPAAGTQPADAQPADAHAGGTQPAGTQSADAQPADAQPADAHAGDSIPAGTGRDGVFRSLGSAGLDRMAGTGPATVPEPAAERDRPARAVDGAGRPVSADVTVRVGDRFLLVGYGRVLPASDRRILDAFAIHATAALERGRLAEQAAEAEGLAATDRLRTALLRAVGHDLRSPLASAKAAVSSLRGSDVAWSPDERDELLATADESLDRLNRLVDNLLDMSRLQAGVLSVAPAPVGLDEIALRAVDSLGPLAEHVVVRIPEGLPAALADPVLAERVVANLVANAVRHSGTGGPAPLVTASVLGGTAYLRVVDHGAGVPPADWERIFTPFQRLGDRGTGVGLGLALSRGLAEAMGGTLVPEETPGGGLTMVFTVPAAADAPVPDPSTPDMLS